MDDVAVPERVAAACEAVARAAADDPALFISLAPPAELRDRAARLDPALPLAGCTFAVKDNVDVAGLPTTAAFPPFAAVPGRSAFVIARLEAAGALCVGKTNLDQFATGLVGTRSPYGAPRNPVDPRLAPGGSSSGSAVAVALGVVDFAVGTDTAGSGRVPAAACRVVGLKPTVGRLSTVGVVPAVRSIDVVSIFATTVGDAWSVLAVADGFDPADAFARRAPDTISPGGGRIGLPVSVDLDGDADRAAWAAARERVGAMAAEWGLELVEVDIEPMLEVGRLLYGGPFVAERLAAVGDVLAAHPEAADPTVAAIIGGGAAFSAVDAYRGAYRLAEGKRRIEAVWDAVDALVMPTTPGPATLAEVVADPVGRSHRLGLYTTFGNLADTAAVAVPGPDRADGWPFGISVVAPAWQEARAATLAARLTGEDWEPPPGPGFDMVVVGAHLLGQPLNWQLTELGGRRLEVTTTAAVYRLFALTGTTPPKPGLVRVGPGEGGAIEVEVWRVPTAAVGRFVARVPPPLCIGTVALAGGRSAHGFLCEPGALHGAVDITDHGGWRAYLAAR